MKLPSVFFAAFLLTGCLNSVDLQGEHENEAGEGEPVASDIYTLPLDDDRIFFIEDKVYDTDKNDTLYLEEEVKQPKKGGTAATLLTIAYTKKHGDPLKVWARTGKRSDTTVLTAYYHQGKLIKTTGEFWGPRVGWKKVYVYYHEEQPIRASTNASHQLIRKQHAFGMDLKNYLSKKVRKNK